MDAGERQGLLRHIEALHAEIAIVERELELEDASTDLYEPRIRELEEELEDTQKVLLDIRRAIAASSRRRWQRWPVGWIAVGVLVVFVFLEWR